MVSFPDQQQQIGGGLMPWGRLDDQANTNAKLLALSDPAWRMWGCGLIYCQANLTDGFIPEHVIHTFGVRAKNKSAIAAELCQSLVPGKGPCWHKVDGGYQVHDYLDWNDSRESVTAERAKSKERIERWRERARNGVTNALETPDEHVSTTTPTTTTTPTQRIERADRAPAWNPHGVRPHSRSLVGSHTGCYPTPKACARGICLPGWLGSNWLRQFADPVHGEREIEATVSEAVDGLPDGPISEKPQKFWEAVWAARHPSRAPVTATKTAGKGLTALSSFASAEARRSARGDGS